MGNIYYKKWMCLAGERTKYGLCKSLKQYLFDFNVRKSTYTTQRY